MARTDAVQLPDACYAIAYAPGYEVTAKELHTEYRAC